DVEGQGLPGPGPPAPLHAWPQVARVGPPAPAGLGRLGYDAGPRAQGPAHGGASGRGPRDRAEPRDPAHGPDARAARHLGSGPGSAQRHRHGEEGLMANGKDTKKKAPQPAAKKAPAAKVATPAKAAPAAKAETNAKAAAAAQARAKAPAKAAPAKPRAVARPITRVVKREEEAPRKREAARPAPGPSAEPRPFPTAPAGHAPLIAADGRASGSVELPAAIASPAKRPGVIVRAMLAAPAR